MGQSVLYFNSTTENVIGIKVIGTFLGGFNISDLTFTKENNISNLKGIGLELSNIQSLNLKNVEVFYYEIGVKSYNVNISSFENLKIKYCKTGFLGEVGDVTPPNLLKFNNCLFGSNSVKAIKLNTLHSVYFDSCAFEDNGTQSLTNAGAFEGIFNPLNGLQSVNFNSCYFEQNGGDYDIKIQNNNLGTSSVNNCTFNRVNLGKYVINNIYLVSDLDATFQFTNSILLSGNGFFTAGNYTSDITRPTLAFNSNAGYKGFNVIEQNNIFSNTLDKFVIPQTIKQESSNTKLLASARTGGDGSVGFKYNIESVVRQGVGNYLITFKNELPHNPIISASAVGGFAIPYIASESLSSIVVITANSTGTPIDMGMSISVH